MKINPILKQNLQHFDLIKLKEMLINNLSESLFSFLDLEYIDETRGNQLKFEPPKLS
jgi:hypothetical protein